MSAPCVSAPTCRWLAPICPYSSERSAEIIKSINASAKTIRYELAQRVRYQLRKTPELTFFVDDSLDYAENIDRLLATDGIGNTEADAAAGDDGADTAKTND